MYVTMYDTNWNYIGSPGVIAYDTREIIHSVKHKDTSCFAYLMQLTTPSSSWFVHSYSIEILKPISVIVSHGEPIHL